VKSQIAIFNDKNRFGILNLVIVICLDFVICYLEFLVTPPLCYSRKHKKHLMKLRCWHGSPAKAPLILLMLVCPLLITLSAGRATAGENNPIIIILEFHGLKREILAESLEDLPNFREIIKGANDDQAYVYLPQVFTTIPAASQLSSPILKTESTTF